MHRTKQFSRHVTKHVEHVDVYNSGAGEKSLIRYLLPAIRNWLSADRLAKQGCGGASIAPDWVALQIRGRSFLHMQL